MQVISWLDTNSLEGTEMNDEENVDKSAPEARRPTLFHTSGLEPLSAKVGFYPFHPVQRRQVLTAVFAAVCMSDA